MPKFELRIPGVYDSDAASHESGLVCDPDEGVTQQQFAEECDINTIVRRFGVTGELPPIKAMPISGDFVDAGDFQSAMQLVRQAQEGFNGLSPELRRRFNNDPGALIEFLEDVSNREEAVKLGIVAPPPEVVTVDKPD